MPQLYAPIWAKAWDPYLEFSKNQTQDHPSHELVQEILKEKLRDHLLALENYTVLVERYIETARQLKKQPGDVRLQQMLKSSREQLCGRKLLEPYNRSGRAALEALEAIAGMTQPYIRIYKLGVSETPLLTTLLKTVGIVSAGVNKDLQDYVTNTSRTLDVLAQTVHPDS
jgi:hypothetical protein